MEDQNKIRFHSLVKPFFLPKRNALKQYLKKIAVQHGRQVKSLTYIFCTDEYLQNLNKKYLGHGYLTDIITFPYSEENSAIEADIFISVERVRENASIYKNSTSSELLRVIIHGLLHLCGIQDKTENEKSLMRKKEDELLRSYKSFT